MVWQAVRCLRRCAGLLLDGVCAGGWEMSAILSCPTKGRITERPGDDEIIECLTAHFDETPFGVIQWIKDMDLNAALCRDQGIEPN